MPLLFFCVSAVRRLARFVAEVRRIRAQWMDDGGGDEDDDCAAAWDREQRRLQEAFAQARRYEDEKNLQVDRTNRPKEGRGDKLSSGRAVASKTSGVRWERWRGASRALPSSDRHRINRDRPARRSSHRRA
jgi:hypothetical protein